MKLANALYLAVAAGGMLLAHSASAQDVRAVQLRFRKAGDTTVIIRGAAVRVDHTIDVVTDSAGIARIAELEDGGHIVEVVAKGYEAYFDNFVSGPGPMPIDLEIRAFVEPPKQKSEPTGLKAADFAKRRALGQGKFFTLEQMKAADGRPLANFLKVDASAYIATGPKDESFLASRAGSRPSAPCYAAVVRDGLRIYPIEGVTPPNLDKIFTDDIASIEYYATTPAALGVASKCGVLLLWSRRP